MSSKQKRTCVLYDNLFYLKKDKKCKICGVEVREPLFKNRYSLHIFLKFGICPTCQIKEQKNNEKISNEKTK